MKKQKYRKLLTYVVICAVAVMAALNYHLFVFPNRFAPAGLNGICTMIQYITGISVGYMSLLINIPLAIFVYLKVSKSLAMRSMFYVGIFSILLVVLEKVDLSQFAYYTENGTSTILGPLVGGIIFGAGYSVLVRGSANSGGTDFVAAIIHKYRPDMNMFYIIFALNVTVAISSYFVYDFEMEPVILCILYSFMSSTVSDSLMKSVRGAVRLEIVTDDPDELSRELIRELNRSVTLIRSKGMYSGEEKSVLICVVSKAQIPALTEILDRYPNTFAIMSSVSQVMGNFKRRDNRSQPERELLDKGDGWDV